MNAATRRVIEHAALAGTFNPSRFLYDIEGGIEPVLSALAPLCHEVIRDGEVMWRMHNADRTRVLRSLVATPRRLNRLVRKRPPLKSDVFAQVLDRCLRGQTMPKVGDLPKHDPDMASQVYREAISAAVAAQSVVPAKRRKQLDAFESALYRASVKQAEEARRRIILPGKLCGREDERAEVLGFLDDVQSPTGAVTEFANRQPRAARSLLVLGSPGLGKSAFLTDVAQRIGRKKPARWMLKFDFDQMTLLHGDLIAWTEEATRQLGQQVPAAAPALSGLRRQLAAERTGSSLERDLSFADQLVSQTAEILSRYDPRPLVLLIDTIEELVARDMRDLFRDAPMSTAFYRLIEWVDQIGAINGQAPTHAIYSGRIAPPLPEDRLGEWFDAQLTLSPLTDAAAAELLALRDPGMQAGTRKALVAALGGHPLHLIIAQKHINNLPDEEREKVIADLDTAGLRGLASDEVLQTLYTRFLARMSLRHAQHGVTAEMVQALAHPGLLLREVTVDVLAEVIAPAVGVDLSDPARAAEAFRILRDQVWLVNASADGASITHRADVRRVMLPMMLSENRTPEVAKVLERAVHYYESRGARAHAAYSRALAGQHDWMLNAPDLAAEVFSLAGQDEVEMFDTPVRAHLKYFSPSGGELSQDELDALSDALKLDAQVSSDVRQMRATGARKKGGAQGGVGLDAASPAGSPEPSKRHLQLLNELDRIGQRSGAHDILNHRPLQDEITILFNEARFDELAFLGWQALDRLRVWPDLSRPLGLDVAFEDHWLWRLTLASMVAPAPELTRMVALLGDDKTIARAATRAAQRRSLEIGIYDFDMLLSTPAAQAQFGSHGLIAPNFTADYIWEFDTFTRMREFRIARQSAFARMHGDKRGNRLQAIPMAAQPLLASDYRGNEAVALSLGWLTNSTTKRKSAKRSEDEDLRLSIFGDGLVDRWTVVPPPDKQDALFTGLARHLQAELSLRVLVEGKPAEPDYQPLDRVARGQTPELHPCAAALLTSELDPETRALCFEGVIAQAPFWPKGAERAHARLGQPSSGGRTVHDAALDLVRFTDLCGLLTPLIEAMASASDSVPVQRLAELNRALDAHWTWPRQGS